MSFGSTSTFKQFGEDDGLGHNGVKITLNYFDGWPSASLVDNLPSNDLKVNMKLLMKRDETTKEKSLTEITDIVENFDVNQHLFENDIFMLCWTQVYAKLCMNESKIIRSQANHVTTLLIKHLRKKVAKFLKDLIPFLLLGCTDMDNQVSKRTQKDLLDAFNGSTDKVEFLWTGFNLEILRLAEEVVIVENANSLTDERYCTKEESDFKYNRVLSGVVLLMVILLEHKQNLEELKEDLNSLLSNESLWNSLSFKNSKNMKTYESLLKLLDCLWRAGYLARHKDVLKLSIRKIFKSMAQVSTSNAMSISAIAPEILSILVQFNEYKNGAIWGYDKTSKEKIMNFLSVFIAVPFPGLCNKMLALYEATRSIGLLDDQMEWLPIWRKGTKSLSEKLVLGRYGKITLEECWSTYLSFLKSARIEDAEKYINDDAMTLITSKKKLGELPTLAQNLARHLNTKSVVEKLDQNLFTESEHASKYDNTLSNLLCIVLVSSDAECILTDIIQHICNYLEEISDDPTKLNSNVIDFIQTLLDTCYEDLDTLLFDLIYLITDRTNPANFEQNSSLIISYSKSKSYQRYAKCDAITNFVKKSLQSKIPSQNMISFLNMISKEAYSSLRKVEDNTMIKKIVNEYIESYDFPESDFSLSGNIIDTSTIILLYENAKSKGHLSTFCSKLGTTSLEVTAELLIKTDIIETCVNSDTVEYSNLLTSLIEKLSNNDEVMEKVLESIKEQVRNNDDPQIFERCLKIITELLQESKASISTFLPDATEDLLGPNFSFIDYRLTLVDYLQSNYHILDNIGGSWNIANMEMKIRESMFLDRLATSFPNLVTTEILAHISVMAEIATDYNCLSENPHDEYMEFHNTLFSKNNETAVDLVSAIETITSSKEHGPGNVSLSYLTFSTNKMDATSIYKVRVIEKLLNNSADSLSTKGFEIILPIIDRFMVKSARNTDEPVNLFMSAIILRVFDKFLRLDNFDKLRSILFSELVGINANEFVTEKYKLVLLLNNLLIAPQDDEKSYIPVPLPKISMALNSLETVLDSDLIYDELFMPCRIALLSFFIRLLQYPEITKRVPKLFELSVKILSDSLSLCLMESTPYAFELRQIALDLHWAIEKQTDLIDTAQVHDENKEIILDICFFDFSKELNNQISAKFYRALTRITDSMNNYVTQQFSDRLFEAFLDVKSTKDINRDRLLVKLLRSQICAMQQTNIIEYELRAQQKASLPDPNNYLVEDDTFKEEFEIPHNLINTLDTEAPEEYLEHENEIKFIRYLWSWYLALSYFEDASYNMRQLFIGQLQERDLVFRVFDFIVNQIDFNDKEFWYNTTAQNISNYDIAGNEFNPYKEIVMDECKHLLAYILFRLFYNVGPITGKWFVNMKNRSLQKTVDEFVTRFISPVLIEMELIKVDEKMHDLVKRETELSIKINKKVNEVKASYLIDDQKLEIAFRIPANYPLTNIQVVGVSRIGITEQKWKQWILSTQHVIIGMNGSVLDCLELFSRNVNLQFSGFEECAICYSILHAVDRKLPSKTCPTCSNRFHSACLYKWFRSSGNNTCPLCRGEIPFK